MKASSLPESVEDADGGTTSPNDRLDQSVEEDAHGGTTSPNNGLDQPNEPPPNASPARPSPILRSSRMRKPARYGSALLIQIVIPSRVTD